MSEIKVLGHVVRPHEPRKGEDYNPGLDMLIVVHGNPNDPDDPTEFGHHIRLEGLANRKEMWGTSDYANTIDTELRDLERYYARSEDVEYGPYHPLADITEHYFDAPQSRMRSFAPSYVMQRVMPAVMPGTTDGVMQMCLDTVMSGIGDVKECLASTGKKSFPCKGMTGLSVDSADVRKRTISRMEEQTQRMKLVSCKGLDDVRQLLTDRESELEVSREGFVNHALMAAQVPEIMRRRVVNHAVQNGFLPERWAAR